jgi:hypothetical protein
MHIKLLSGLALLALALPADGQPAPKAVYFPTELHAPSVACGNDRKMAILSDFEDGWFSQHLTAAREPSLFEQALKSPGGTNSYRFTLLRSFHAPVTVRIEENAQGEMLLTTKVLSGKGGYEPGRIAEEKSRQLTPAERENVRRMFIASDFVNFRADPCILGLDGAEWIIETRVDGKYRLVKQWSPTEGAVYRIGISLLKLTGLSVGPIY